MNQIPQEHQQQSFHQQAGRTKSSQSNSPLQILGCTATLLLVVIAFSTIVTYYIYHPVDTNITQSTPVIKKVGDTITIDNVSCTLIMAFGTGDIIIRVKLVNNSKGEYHYYASDLQIKTSSGSIIAPEQDGGGALAPGGTVYGYLDFLVANSHNSELIWQPSGYSDDLSHGWILNL